MYFKTIVCIYSPITEMVFFFSFVFHIIVLISCYSAELRDNVTSRQAPSP